MLRLPLEQSFDAFLSVTEARNQTLKQQAGNPHGKRPHSFIASCFNWTLPPAPSVKTNSGGSWFIPINSPLPPCVQSIDQLLPLSLSDLVMGNHHRGKFLLVRMVQDVGCGRIAAFALVYDQSMDFKVLKLPFVCMNLEVGHRWPRQSHLFAIKEPYLTIDEGTNETCIRVDHPSDLLDATRLSKPQLARLVSLGFEVEQHEMLPLQCNWLQS